MSDIRIVQVAVQKSSGGYNLLSLSAYNAMALVERMKLIQGKKLQFLTDTGQVVPTLKALQSLANI